MKASTLLLLGALLVPFGSAAAQTTDQGRPVRDVLIAEVNGDLPRFLGLMKQIETVNQRLGLGAKLRVFRATFAGERTGEVYVYWELPSFVRFAEVETKLHQDPEYRRILGELDEAGMGFRSELLTIEITPH
ncbi:MAG: hypothetical protein AB7R55_11020 [Gemmatimonadales bacterium]